MRSEIQEISAREILNSKGKPTIAVDVKTAFGKYSASVPSGTSKGKYEAVELDVDNAIKNIKTIIAPALAGKEFSGQEEIDKLLVGLDGTKNKSRLGANAILAVSIASCRAGAAIKKIPLYFYISQLSGTKPKLPKPSFNMIEGGKHAANGLSFQEFMVIPQEKSFKENLEIGKRIYSGLKNILEKKSEKTTLSAEGAFSTITETTITDYASAYYIKALNMIMEAAREENARIAIDAAASSFYKNGEYEFEERILPKEELKTIYHDILKRYPVISIEDPFFEEDFGDIAEFSNKVTAIFGDDLTVSNVGRIKLAKEKNACSGLILKPNQIGTVTETLEAANLAKSFGWKIMVSNRAGETKDDFIADLAVGIGADFIKSGAPFPKERMAKYNRLIEIEKELT